MDGGDEVFYKFHLPIDRLPHLVNLLKHSTSSLISMLPATPTNTYQALVGEAFRNPLQDTSCSLHFVHSDLIPKPVVNETTAVNTVATNE